MNFTKHQTPNTKHQTPNTKHQTPNTKHQTPNTKHQAITKYLLLLVVFSLTLFQCQKEDDTLIQQAKPTDQSLKTNFTIKEVSLNEVIQSTNIKSTIGKIEGFFDVNKQKTSSNTYYTLATNDPITTNDNSFTILTDEIIEVTTSTTKVYAFRIETCTDTNSDFENFVIIKHQDNSISYHLYKYTKDETNSDILGLSREEINPDLIKKEDFEDYINTMFYDEENNCYVNVYTIGDNLVLDFFDCDALTTTGGDSVTVTYTGGTTNNGWVYFNPDGDTSNGCIRTRRYTDANGVDQEETEFNVPCPDTINTDNSNNDSTSDDTNSNTVTDSVTNSDPLHSDSGGGNPDTTNVQPNEEEIIVPVLKSKIDIAIDVFFNSLPQNQQDYLNSILGGTVKKEIETYLENNQTIQKPGSDEPILSNEVLNFAELAVEALSDNGDVDFENRLIIQNNVPECVENIISSLKQSSGNVILTPGIGDGSNLAPEIFDLFQNNPQHNLEIMVSTLPNNKNAQTEPKYDSNNQVFVYTITLNELFVNNATDLAIARTIIHEALHAYLLFTYQDNIFSTLSQVLSHHFNLLGYENINPVHHQLMTSFVDAMALSLQNWDNNSLGNINYYNYLSWSGDMINTTAFNQLSSDFQQNVIDANLAEGQAIGEATSDANGTKNCN